jgi:septal ring factor EnvC (AmiA/AmiB activator)
MKALIYGILFIFFGLSFAESDIDKQLQGNRKQLNRIKEEINTLRKEIAKTDIKASSTLEQIKLIDHEISLLGKTTRLMNQETQLLAKQIGLIRDQLYITRRKLKTLKDQYANRVMHLYKYGKIQNLELLINSQSINQALVRYKYLRLFNDQEKKVIQKIHEHVTEIQTLEQELSLDYQTQRQVLLEKEKQQVKYIARKNDKKVMVERLKWNSQNLNKQLKSAESEYQKLYQLIVTLERKRKERESSGELKETYALNLKDFKKNKGKLPWPVQGKIIHPYGKQRDTRLKTTINNTGIDIKAASGSNVRSVFIGLVSMITYLSGFGNTIILDHGEGYYTVYSHLDEFFVDPEELVEAGSVIGLVGDSGSLEGSKLHFAIFANQKTENPQTWLR